MCLLEKLPVDREWVGDPLNGEVLTLEVIHRKVIDGSVRINGVGYTGSILTYEQDALARLTVEVIGCRVADKIYLRVSVTQDPRLQYLIVGTSDDCYLSCGGEALGCGDCKQERLDDEHALAHPEPDFD
jgi:hypothetical protein